MIALILSYVVALVASADPTERPRRCPKELNTDLIREFSPPKGISWLVRSAPGTREISYGSAEHGASEILNVDTGVRTTFPGLSDPVLSPDGKIMTMPAQALWDGRLKKFIIKTEQTQTVTWDYEYRYGKMVAAKYPEGSQDISGRQRPVALTVREAELRGISYNVQQAMTTYTRGPGGQPVLTSVERDNSADYQSIGKLGKSGDQHRYRMLFLNGEDQISVKTVTYDERTKQVNTSLPAKTACGNGLSVDTPMINKQGTEFSYYDRTARATRIMSIDQTGTKCSVKEVIPAWVGKVDFSPDGSKIAFHMDSKAESKRMQFNQPRATQKLGAYVYDRRTGRYAELDDEPGTNSYYPTFVSDDEIAYVHDTVGTKDDKGMKIKLVRLKPDVGTTCRDCATDPESAQVSALLARMYAESCGFFRLDFKTAPVGLAKLTRPSCLEFVGEQTEARVKAAKADLLEKDGWDQKILKGVTVTKLRGICERISVAADSKSDSQSAH